MKTHTHTVYLMDEAPNLGCGRRVLRAKAGRKWVHLSTVARAPRKARMRRTLWEQIVAES